jgi:hypothetical protein
MSGSAAILGQRLRPATLYPHARGSVLVPLALSGLPQTIEADGETWAVKEEFHVTAAHTPSLAQRAGVTHDRAWEELSAALADRRVGLVRVGDELRRARDRDERTILVMVHVDGLTDLYSDLSRRLGASLPPPPTHITLYTRPGGKAIGIHDDSDLHSLTEPLSGARAAEVRGAMHGELP